MIINMGITIYFFAIILGLQLTIIHSFFVQQTDNFFRFSIVFFIIISIIIMKIICKINYFFIINNPKSNKLIIIKKKISCTSDRVLKLQLRLFLLDNYLKNDDYKNAKTIIFELKGMSLKFISKDLNLQYWLLMIYYFSAKNEILEAENYYLKAEKMMRKSIAKNKFLMEIYSSLSVYFYVKNDLLNAKKCLEKALAFPKNSKKGNLQLLLNNIR